VTERVRMRVTAPLFLSLLLHLGAAAGLLFVRKASPPASQQYRAVLQATIAGPRALGEVREDPPAAEPVVVPPRSGTPRVESPKTVPVPVTKVPTKANTATKSTVAPDPVKSTKVSAADPTDTKSTKAAPPRAGAGDVGGSGSDVTNAVFKGIDFPDQRYLNNIINRIMHNFPPQYNVALVAELSFEILRDGTMQNLRIIRTSRNGNFDAEAEGAVERAGRNRGFGVLPAAWSDDILRIEFRFDPKLISR